ncbi:hypothetical protein RA279_27835, partial [Pseudomonas syringae pv. tagetis]|uniref:hypothetical protein n=1 Tax=Pseudomonas syringae group genomosp. 7 TaxID=251699 RepID=UPI00376FE8BE
CGCGCWVGGVVVWVVVLVGVDVGGVVLVVGWLVLGVCLVVVGVCGFGVVGLGLWGFWWLGVFVCCGVFVGCGGGFGVVGCVVLGFGCGGCCGGGGVCGFWGGVWGVWGRLCVLVCSLFGGGGGLRLWGLCSVVVFRW